MTQTVHDGEIVLGARVPLVGGLTVPDRGFRFILQNLLADVVQVAKMRPVLSSAVRAGGEGQSACKGGRVARLHTVARKGEGRLPRTVALTEGGVRRVRHHLLQPTDGHASLHTREEKAACTLKADVARRPGRARRRPEEGRVVREGGREGEEECGLRAVGAQEGDATLCQLAREASVLHRLPARSGSCARASARVCERQEGAERRGAALADSRARDESACPAACMKRRCVQRLGAMHVLCSAYVTRHRANRLRHMATRRPSDGPDIVGRGHHKPSPRQACLVLALSSRPT